MECFLNTTNWELNLPSGSAGQTKEVEAFVLDDGGREKVVGRLNIINYQAIQRKMALVPVNGDTEFGQEDLITIEN